MENYSPGYCYHIMNLMRYYDNKSLTAVIALNKEEQYHDELRQLFYHSYLPHRAIVWRHIDDEKLMEAIPFLKQQKPINGKTTLYLCHKGVCDQPLTELSEMITAVRKL